MNIAYTEKKMENFIDSLFENRICLRQGRHVLYLTGQRQAGHTQTHEQYHTGQCQDRGHS